ncbi:MAG: DUF2975 domain-containing protein [Bifidobacterium sp.]|jgi:hypothetical protein|nr:DUF2975 domain-containing protein [Bifidobacterium sp.]
MRDNDTHSFDMSGFDMTGTAVKQSEQTSSGDVSHSHPLLISTIKGLIVLLGFVSLVCQVWGLPSLAAEIAVEDPPHAYLRYPYLAVSIALIVCFEIVLVAMWQLLTMVARGVVFSARARRLVNIVIWAAIVAEVLFAGLWIHGLMVSAGPPLLAVVLLIALIVVLCFILLMVVMRTLLSAATAQRDELEAVV